MQQLSCHSLNLHSLLPPLPVTSYQWDSGRKHFFQTFVFQSPLFPFNEENVWIRWETVVSFPHPWKVVPDFSSGGQLCSPRYRQEQLGAAGDEAQAAELGVSAIVCWQPWRCLSPNLQTFQLAISLRFYSGDMIMPAAYELLICNLKKDWFLDQYNELIAPTTSLGQLHTY